MLISTDRIEQQVAGVREGGLEESSNVGHLDEWTARRSEEQVPVIGKGADNKMVGSANAEDDRNGRERWRAREKSRKNKKGDESDDGRQRRATFWNNSLALAGTRRHRERIWDEVSITGYRQVHRRGGE